MKKLSTFALIILITFSCTSYKRDKFQYRNDDKNVWINTFKSEVFYSCIKEGVKNDSLTIILRNKDLFNIYDGYPIITSEHARDLGRKIIQKLPIPFIKIDTDEEHLKNKNFISYSCLNYYASLELDSIAKNEYSKFLKKEKN